MSPPLSCDAIPDARLASRPGSPSPTAKSNISLGVLSSYFHLPITEVSRRIGICPTVLKKICRRHGIPRWPHRKIKSLDNMIQALVAASGDAATADPNILRALDKLRQRKKLLMKHPYCIFQVGFAPVDRSLKNGIQKLGKPAAARSASGSSDARSDETTALRSLGRPPDISDPIPPFMNDLVLAVDYVTRTEAAARRSAASEAV